MSNNFKIHTDYKHYNPKLRGELFDLLKPFIGKSENYTDFQRQKEYGLSENDFCFCEHLADSDIAVLPMSWNYYSLTGKIESAKFFVLAAEKAGKKVWSWVSGDFGVDVPDFPNLIVFRANGYRSKLPKNHIGLPPFFQDPLSKWYQTDEIFLRNWTDKPVIGFCGHAKGNIQQYGWSIVRTAVRNFRYSIGLSPYQPHPIYPPPLLIRSNILAQIEKEEKIESNFIKRSKYRAGAVSAAERHKTTMEFFENMVNSDYIVCMRGGGNFSVRLYETLSMGRIPVFIDTDCLLPLDNIIPWNDISVRVKYNSSMNITDTIIEFQNNLDPSRFSELLLKNRSIWINHLSLAGFFKTVINSNMLS